MNQAEDLELSDFLDSFWIKNAERIRQVKQAIAHPNTLIGEEIQKEALNFLGFQVYPRAQSIFGSLVTLAEYNEIGKSEKIDYFSSAVNQRIVLKALGLLLEEEIQFPYPVEEKKTFEDYRKFFEGMLEKFRNMDKVIQTQKAYPNFLGSLLMVFGEEAKKLKGIESVRISSDKITGRIDGWLPKLKEIDQGKIFKEIKSKLDLALVPSTL